MDTDPGGTMADKSAFTADEWKALREAPQLISLAVATAGASGLIGTLKEAFSSSAALVEAMKSENAVLRSISSREEISEAQQALRELAAEAKGADFQQTKERIATRALDTLRAALDALQRKGSAGDYDAYAGFARSLAKRVAEAAKEGSFLGFGGERVSEGERAMLAKLDSALAPPPRS
jgi:hypothetical protein